jgi:methionine synthase II (cobalamin-independent)
MGTKKKRNADARAGGGLDERTMERLAAEMQAELDDLYEDRRRRAAERAAMSEEEVRAAMVADLEAVLADAEAIGMDIITVGEDDEG